MLKIINKIKKSKFNKKIQVIETFVILFIMIFSFGSNISLFDNKRSLINTLEDKEINNIISTEPSPSNPVPGPEILDFQFQLCIGPNFNNSNIHLHHANVSIDCYDDYSEAQGYYYIINEQNESVDLKISFISGVTQDLIEVIVNGNESIHFEDNSYFTVNLHSNTTTELYIKWSFSNIVNYDIVGESTGNLELYRIVYSINGGEFWAGTPIDWEEVRFYFHTEKFIVSNDYVLVNIQENAKYCVTCPEKWVELKEKSKEEKLLKDSNGIPYFLCRFENFTESYNIFIISDNWNSDNSKIQLDSFVPRYIRFFEIFGDYCYLGSYDNTIEIINISQKENIQKINELYFPNLITFFKKINEHLLITREYKGSIKIFNVSNPDSPKLISKYEYDGENLNLIDLALKNDMLYLLYQNSIIEIIDVSNYSKPKHLSYVNFKESLKIENISAIQSDILFLYNDKSIYDKFEIEGDKMYIASGRNLYIYHNITADPLLNSREKIDFFGISQFIVKNSTFYVLSDFNQFKIYNGTFSYPYYDPKYEFMNNTYHFEINNNILYLIFRHDDEFNTPYLSIYNISDNLNPIEIISLDISNFSQIYELSLKDIDNHYLFISERSSGITLLDVSNITHPKIAGNYISYIQIYKYDPKIHSWAGFIYIILILGFPICLILILKFIDKKKKKRIP